MTQRLSTQVYSVPPEHQTEIINADLWNTTKTTTDPETYQLFTKATHTVFGQSLVIQGCAELHPQDNALFMYNFEGKDFFNEIETQFTDISLTPYSPTYTEVCSLMRSADKANIYGMPTTDTTEPTDVTEQVNQGENIPITDAFLTWNEPAELKFRYDDAKMDIHIEQTPLEEIHTTETFNTFVSLLKQHFLS